MFMDIIKGFFFFLLTYFPWLVILAAGGAALMRRRTPAVLIQAIGALMVFGVGLLRWLLMSMVIRHSTYSTVRTVDTLFTLVAVVALVTFAAGYAWEKYQVWSEPHGA